MNFYREHFLFLRFGNIPPSRIRTVKIIVQQVYRFHTMKNEAEQTSLEMETLAIIYSFLSHLGKLSNHKFSRIFLNFRLRHFQNLWHSENNWLNKISAKQSKRSQPNQEATNQPRQKTFYCPFYGKIIWLTLSDIPRLGWSLCLPWRLKAVVSV